MTVLSCTAPCRAMMNKVALLCHVSRGNVVAQTRAVCCGMGCTLWSHRLVPTCVAAPLNGSSFGSWSSSSWAAASAAWASALALWRLLTLVGSRAGLASLPVERPLLPFGAATYNQAHLISDSLCNCVYNCLYTCVTRDCLCQQ